MTRPKPLVFQPWDVYWLPNVVQMNPPKPKFVVVIDATSLSFRGFVINSAYPPFVQNVRPALQTRYAPILMTGHAFLHHDSFIDCTDILTFAPGDIASARRVGRLTRGCATAVQIAVSNSDTIKIKTQNIISGMPLP